MKELLKKFEEKTPEIVFEWSDAETEACGWVVINSLRGGAAGGGTRMRKGLDRREVESLAKTMEVKFTVSRLPIGGAKSGINFDPRDPRRDGVLRRWFKAVTPLLKNYYGTGGDMNVDEIRDVIPITNSYGIWHPQEGIVQGHYQPNEKDFITKISNLREGESKDVESEEFLPGISIRYSVADLITGYGVAESVKHYYDLWGGSIKGKRVVVQGWGNVGAAAGFYMAKMGAKITGIIDRDGGLLNPEGYTEQQVRDLMLNRDKNMLVSDDLVSFEEANEKIWDIGCDIFLPCAGSRLVTADHVDRLVASGLEVISSGANVPFADPEIFYGDIFSQADQKVAIIPDFIANCGMARVFGYLMSDEARMDDQSIFQDVSYTIKEALTNIHKIHPDTKGIAGKALEYSISQLV